MSAELQSNFDNIEFDLIWQAIKARDEEAESLAIQKVTPQMLAALQRRFGSNHVVDKRDAVQSALRTVLRREWKLFAEPRNWSELTGLLVRYAHNKARTMLKRTRPDRQSGPDIPNTDDVLATVFERELVEAFESELESAETEDKTIICGKLDCCTLREIAERLDAVDIVLTEDQIKYRWHEHIVRRLKKLFEEFE